MKEVVKIALVVWMAVIHLNAQQQPPISSYFRPSILSVDSLNYKSRWLPDSFSHPRNQLPFFCALEDKCWKQSGIPFKFRLGSLSYTNYLENKGRYPYILP